MSTVGEKLLYTLSKRWPSPVKERESKLGEYPTSEQYLLNYALHAQYLQKLKQGVSFNFHDKEILEIGCGHGGITCFLAVNGAKKVVGIDLNTRHLEIAKKFANRFSFGLNGKDSFSLPVEFYEMNVFDLMFPTESFDIVLADNVFEHFTDPEKALSESYRVLKPGGMLIVPIFSSIWSKYALHLKHGLKVPWANLFFTEKTICKVMYRLALEKPNLFEAYPGLKDKPTRVKDIRKYKDLNDITYGKFKRMATETGFSIQSFFPVASKDIRFFAKVIRHLPLLDRSLIADVFSTGASAVLVKPVK
jgi:ubiquinone/menaquinone biosynthesis C-methylase UbiE